MSFKVTIERIIIKKTVLFEILHIPKYVFTEKMELVSFDYVRYNQPCFYMKDLSGYNMSFSDYKSIIYVVKVIKVNEKLFQKTIYKINLNEYDSETHRNSYSSFLFKSARMAILLGIDNANEETIETYINL